MFTDLFKLASLVEIVILGAAYFFILSSIRGTRGAALLKGVVLFLLAAFGVTWWLATHLGLEVIQRVLSWLLSASSIAAIVIFAPEMRRALLRLAQSPLFSPLIRNLSLTVVDELVNAAVRLSKNRIGALIAIQRDIGLSEYIEKGVRLDAALSSELIESIFYPGNPLHDGAVIVQHDRVVAAACFFPLSEEESISRSMGTRHRAALGLSEETDAAIIVVSEETGRISLCRRSKIRTDLTREMLDQALRELYTRAERGPLLPFRPRRRGAPAPVPPSGDSSNDASLAEGDKEDE
ncbi:MAG: TIGR00159 family protein [Planctomycetes bacterium]|nr:TIGR00159 family protein [Planctomycetota bacterium]